MLANLRSIARKTRRLLSGHAARFEQTAVAPMPALNPREWAAQTYLAGDGIEIGALQDPLKLPPQARVKYVDRMPVPQLRQQYPELGPLPLVQVDIVDDGEKLSSFMTDSQDFLIANHFLEHCGDPIGTLKHFLRVVRPGGILYLAVPDKRYTFDRDRPVTPLAHLFEDHEKGPERSRRQHFEEWARFVNKCEEPGQIQARMKELMDMDYSIHFHVWTQTEFLEFLYVLKQMLSFEVELFLKHANEMIMILRKISAETQQHGIRAA